MQTGAFAGNAQLCIQHSITLTLTGPHLQQVTSPMYEAPLPGGAHGPDRRAPAF